MIINNPGTYSIIYTAVDDCGNTTTVTREVIVTGEATVTYRTVLYSDGTFIINESSDDMSANVTAHGEAIGVYDPLDADHPYEFYYDFDTDETDVPWFDNSADIVSVEIGSAIQPTSTAFWFFESGIETIDLTTESIDFSNVTTMEGMFSDSSLMSIDLSGINTPNLTNMADMFSNCFSLESVNLDFDTSNVTNISRMFQYCDALTDIDISNLDLSSVTDASYAFEYCSNMAYSSVENSNFASLTNASYMFYYCSSLELVSFCNTYPVVIENADHMFENCTSLTMITSANFTELTSSTSMFTGCTSLVGGNGTAYDADHTDGTYAVVDEQGTLGYFKVCSA